MFKKLMLEFPSCDMESIKKLLDEINAREYADEIAQMALGKMSPIEVIQTIQSIAIKAEAIGMIKGRIDEHESNNFKIMAVCPECEREHEYPDYRCEYPDYRRGLDPRD